MLLPWCCPASQEALEKKSVLRSPGLSNLGPAEWLPEERWREEGSFCHQWGSDQRLYHRQSHVHHGVDFKEANPSGTQRNLEIWWKEMGMPGMCTDPWFSRVSGSKNVLYSMHVWLSGKRNEDEDSPNSTHWLPVYLSPLSNIYRQYGWELTTDCWNHKTEKKKKKDRERSPSTQRII